MVVRTLSILHIFYFQYNHMIYLPISVILLLTVGSLGLALFSKSRNDTNIVNHKIYNYSVFIAGMFVMLDKYVQ
jgi:Na+/H+ antiporter NhaD/arsenite permease-like protein